MWSQVRFFGGGWVERLSYVDTGQAVSAERKDSPLWLEHRKFQGKPRAEVGDVSRNGFWEIVESHRKLKNRE